MRRQNPICEEALWGTVFASPRNTKSHSAGVVGKLPTRRQEHGRAQRRFTAIEDQYAGYTVYDQDYEKIGKVDDLFVDESDQPEYIGVKMGFLGTRRTLIPFQIGGPTTSVRSSRSRRIRRRSRTARPSTTTR